MEEQAVLHHGVAAHTTTFDPLPLVASLVLVFLFFFFNKATELLLEGEVGSPFSLLSYLSTPKLWPQSLVFHPQDCWMSQLCWGRDLTAALGQLCQSKIKNLTNQFGQLSVG